MKTKKPISINQWTNYYKINLKSLILFIPTTKINANIISIIFIYISISANHANNFKAITIVLKSYPIKISQQIKFYLFCITSFSNSFNSS